MAQRIEIDDALLEKARVQCPKYLSRTAFINLLLDKALDGQGKVGGPSEAGTPSTSLTSTSKKKNTYTYIDIGGLVSEQLLFCKADLEAWWELRRKQHGKAAVGTEHAWKASQNALLAILRVHGRKAVEDTVTAALANGWRGIRESYVVLPKAAAPSQQPEPSRHPASRVFQGGRFVDEDGPTTNPALAGLL